MYKSIIRFLLVLVLIPNLVYSNKRDTMETVYLAGGCYWGLEDLIRNIPGVEKTQVGFTGGLVKNVSYKEVSNGNTGHAESIKVVFDNERLTFDNLLFEFFSMHNPTTVNQQGNDIGSQYRSAIFYSNQNQKEISNKVVKANFHLFTTSTGSIKAAPSRRTGIGIDGPHAPVVG